MKRKRHEKFSFGVAVGVVAFSTIATAGTIGFVALNKLKRFIQQSADTSVEVKLYERDWEQLMDELEDDECEDDECEECEIYFECKN